MVIFLVAKCWYFFRRELFVVVKMFVRESRG